MKLLIKTIALSVAIAALCMPTADGCGRNNSENPSHRTEKRHESPAGQGNHNSSNRNENNRRPGQNSRPNNNNHNNGNRPNNNGRPNNSNNHQKPDNRHPHQRPPQGNMGHGPQHNHNNSHFTHTPPPPPMQQPHRPNMPAHRPWHRPTPPPPAFRPAPGWRPFNTILGVTLGSAINISINTLLNNGYNVTGYGNDAVYITNAIILNMIWPDATLFYSNGGMYASEFVYSTPIYNMSRYNSTYGILVRNYGAPVSSTNINGVLTTTWWGSNGQFINLSFQNAIAGNGTTRFFTTLSFGN